MKNPLSLQQKVLAYAALYKDTTAGISYTIDGISSPKILQKKITTAAET
jgi:hypothetical protein